LSSGTGDTASRRHSVRSRRDGRDQGGPGVGRRTAHLRKIAHAAVQATAARHRGTALETEGTRLATRGDGSAARGAKNGARAVLLVRPARGIAGDAGLRARGVSG